MATLFPSLISADLLNLQHQLAVLDPYCDGYHLDLMDGHFVPNITWGPDFINAIAQATQKQLWVHLMATNPRQWIDRFTLPAKSMVDFHVEVDIDHQALLEHIRHKQWHAGITLKPNTPLEALTPLIPYVDYVLIMSVEPGFSGQSYNPASADKIKKLYAYRQEHNLTFKIAVDGGINAQNIQHVVQAGADYVALATAIFGAQDPVAAMQQLKELAN